MIRAYATELLQEAADLDPCTAVIDGGEDQIAALTDYSPDGYAARAAAAVAGRDRLLAMEPADDGEALLRDHLLERFAVTIDFHAAGEDQRELNPAVTGPLQLISQAVQAAGPGDWNQALLRLRAVPEALDGLQRSLRASAERGHVAAVRQVEECVRRCPGWAATMAEIAQGYGDGPLAGPLRTAAFQAGAAYGRLEAFLRTLAGKAPAEDAFGADRYRLWVRRFLGVDPDLAELYAWGWDELRGIEDRMRREADRIRPGATPAEAVAFLDGPDGPGKLATRAELAGWLQGTLDETMAALDGVHFRVPERLRRIDCVLTRDAGISYMQPSTDLSRPGRVSWSAGEGPFDTWYAWTTAYHEGVPGHHLQLGLAAYRGDPIAQRLKILGGRSAATEGWALYAESLMDELGYLEAPGARLGYLMAQALRAARVVLDIGMHLKLRDPADGEVMTPEKGRAILTDRAFQGGHGAYELVRYLGRPGQALSYKAGERVYREVRAAAQARPGFDPADFHEKVLSVDTTGLAHLRTALERAVL